MSSKGIGWIVAGLLAVGGAALAWVYLAGGSGEPSTELTTPTIAGETTTTGGSGASGAGFVIDPTQSIAVFEIDEELSGSPNHVVGTTNVVAGQVQIDPSRQMVMTVEPSWLNAAVRTRLSW